MFILFRAGAERSALFCAVTILTEELRLHKKVNVLSTLRKIKIRRNGAFMNQVRNKIDVCLWYSLS